MSIYLWIFLLTFQIKMANYESTNLFDYYFMEDVLLLAWFISKKCVGPAISDVLLQLLLHIQFKT